MYLLIKNMVCLRCKMVVQQVLEELKIPFRNIEIGRAELLHPISIAEHEAVNEKLLPYDLHIFTDRKTIITEKIKLLIREMINGTEALPALRFSIYLATALHYDYSYLAAVFSETAEQTIERFYITERVEKIKQLMIYDELTIKEISYRLNYSSVAHLCLQFKKLTGQTPSEYKKVFYEPAHDRKDPG